MRGILDALYWRLHSAYLTNNRSESKRFLDMLEDEMKGSEANLCAEIGQRHVERFNTIRNKMAAGEFGRLHGPGFEAKDIAPIAAEEPDKNELAFCQELAANRRGICEAIGCSLGASYVREQQMGEYGRCDFVFTEYRTAKVLEVKMGEATHALVSQIDKYRLATELDMVLGAYDSVEAYVLAGSYPKYVLDELGRASVVALSHDNTPNNIKRLV